MPAVPGVHRPRAVSPAAPASSTLRAARIASSASVLPPERRSRRNRPTSSTRSPRPVRKRVRPAPNEPVPSTANARRPGACSVDELQRLRVAVAARGDGRLEHDRSAERHARPRAHASRGADQHRPRSPADLQASEPTSSPSVGGHNRCRSGDGNRWRHNCDGSRAQRRGQASDQASKRAPGRHRTLRSDTSLERHRRLGSFAQSSHKRRAPTPT